MSGDSSVVTITPYPCSGSHRAGRSTHRTPRTKSVRKHSYTRITAYQSWLSRIHPVVARAVCSMALWRTASMRACMIQTTGGKTQK